MLEKAIELIRPKLTRLCWVELYGGLTQLIRDPECPEDQIINTYYPVTCSTNFNYTECKLSGRYKALVPDSKYASLLYFEEIEDYTITNYMKDADYYTVKARLMIWVNLKKLGYDICSVKHLVIPSIKGAITGRYRGDDIDVTSVKVVKVHSHENTAKYWSRYRWKEVEALFFYPCEIMSMDIEFKICVDTSCYEEFICKKPIACIEL